MRHVRSVSRRALAATGLLLFAAAGTVRGDGCSSCGPPSDAAFRGAMGPLFRDFGSRPDTYEYDGGECEVTVGPITQSKVGEELLALGSGEALFCPWGKVDSEANFSLTLTAEYDWSLTSSVGGEFGADVLAKLKLGASEQVGGSAGAGTTTSIKQKISANWCKRLPWVAFFIVGQYEATADFTVTRRFRWWIKNSTTGDTVIAAGDIYLTCASGTATMGRLWPISATLGIQHRSCGANCPPENNLVTFHPPLPEDLKPPFPWPPTDGVPEEPAPQQDEPEAPPPAAPTESPPTAPIESPPTAPSEGPPTAPSTAPSTPKEGS